MIHVEDIGKRYRLGAGGGPRYGTLRDTIANGVRRIWRRGGAPRKGNSNVFWALRHVSFDVSEGEVVGIIGKNGAGKSTLLKLMSRITPPTEGRIRLKGRVASLLEVGTGFHPELTGRENVFMNGAILGMRQQEIRAKLDEIVAFSEVEKFIDSPVKHYSSGMYVRLAFAVAAHLEPEILIVDEVLAVGDAEFQKKCLGKMGEVARGGRTVLFVSHNMGAINRLCERAILLEGGRKVFDGTAEEVTARYLSSGAGGGASVEFPMDPEKPDAQIVRVGIVDESGQRVSGINTQKAHFLEVAYDIRQPLRHHRISVTIHTLTGDHVFTTNSTDHRDKLVPVTPGHYVARVAIPRLLFNPGEFIATLALCEPGAKTYDVCENAIRFAVEGYQVLPRQKGGVLCGAFFQWEVHKVPSRETVSP